MKNIEFSYEDNKLIIKIDLTQQFDLPDKQDVKIIASTEGNIPVPEIPNTKLGLYLYKTNYN